MVRIICFFLTVACSRAKSFNKGTKFVPSPEGVSGSSQLESRSLTAPVFVEVGPQSLFTRAFSEVSNYNQYGNPDGTMLIDDKTLAGSPGGGILQSQVLSTDNIGGTYQEAAQIAHSTSGDGTAGSTSLQVQIHVAQMGTDNFSVAGEGFAFTQQDEFSEARTLAPLTYVIGDSSGATGSSAAVTFDFRADFNGAGQVAFFFSDSFITIGYDRASGFTYAGPNGAAQMSYDANSGQCSIICHYSATLASGTAIGIAYDTNLASGLFLPGVAADIPINQSSTSSLTWGYSMTINT